MGVTSSYIICATPRSGSNVLCEVLSSLGFAGRPFEHFWVPEGTELEPLEVAWQRCLAAGRGPNGVFGTKLMYDQAHRLEEELPAALGIEGSALPRVLADALASPKYVYLTRRDHCRQAISLTRALQSGQWRSMDEASNSPTYDHEAITRSMQFLDQDERDWKAFFTRNGLLPYRMTYEALNVDLPGEVVRLLAFLGNKPAGGIQIPVPQHRRQADDLTDQWARRYAGEESACGSGSQD